MNAGAIAIGSVAVVLTVIGVLSALRPRGRHSDQVDVTGPQPGAGRPGLSDPDSTLVDLPAFEATPVDAGWGTARPRPFAPPAAEAAPLLAEPAPPEPAPAPDPDRPDPLDVPPGDVPAPGDEPEPLDVPTGPAVPDEGGAAEADRPVDFPVVFEPSAVLARARQLLGDPAAADLVQGVAA